MRRSGARGWIAGTLLLALIGGPAVATLARPPERTYAFVGVDHPIDMWRDGQDQWAYFGGNDFGPSSAMAQKARAALLPLGFLEDTSERPWYRFVKDREEVVVCDHAEFEVDPTTSGASKLAHNSLGDKPQNYPCVLVKNGPGTHESTAVFGVKKLVLGW